MLDYETLKFVWWIIVGVLLMGFAITDGMDMGVGTLLPFVGRTDVERRVAINTVGPHWDGNQVWFITAGGAIFAAWPAVYAAAFSGFYMAMLLVLFALFFRPVGFDYRSKIENPTWRNAWDWGLFAGRCDPGADLRRRLRKSAAGRPVPARRVPARPLSGLAAHRAAAAAQPVRAARRHHQPVDAHGPRRHLASTTQFRRGRRARAIGGDDVRSGRHRGLRAGRDMAVARHRRLSHRHRAGAWRGVEPAPQGGGARARCLARRLWTASGRDDRSGNRSAGSAAHGCIGGGAGDRGSPS